MNQIQLIGRLTRNPELRYTPNNKPVASFTIAVNRIGQDTADFINCVVWNNQAKNLCKYQEKGSQIAIVGSLRVEKYQDNNGDNRYKTYVLANHIDYLDKKNKENGKDINVTTTEEKEDPFAEFGEEIQLNDEDLPF